MQRNTQIPSHTFSLDCHAGLGDGKRYDGGKKMGEKVNSNMVPFICFKCVWKCVLHKLASQAF